jgi:phytol kinase
MVNPLYAFGILDWIWDLIALLVTFVVFFALIRLTIYLQRRKKIPSAVTPYVFQIFVGPLFLVCWLLYSGVFFSRYMAAIVPAFLILYSILIVFFNRQDEGFVESMAYEGDKYNLLTGPFFYLIIMVFAVFYLWYVPIDLNGTPLFTNFIPTAILILGPLSGGAAVANLVTERYSKRTFRILAKKSVEGTLAMFCLSLLSTVGILGVYWIVLEPAFASINITFLILPIIVTTIIATIVELLSPRHVDIILIPIIVFITIAILSVIGLYPYWLLYPFRPPF